MEKQTVIARNEAISPTQSAPLLPHLRFKEFEDEWEKTNILSISEKVTDGTHDTPKTSKEGNPYLTAIHVKDGFINYNDCYYLSDEEHNKIYKRCNPEKGDLLMVNIGAGTATTALVKVDFQFSLKNVALIKPKKNIVDSNFFSQVQRMNSSRLRHQLSSGGAQPFLSLKEIGRLKLSIPKLPEQQKIASFLSAIDTKLQQLTTKKEKLAQYKKGVMQQLFSQQLRFKADDGSASQSLRGGTTRQTQAISQNETEFPDWEEKKLGEVFKIFNGFAFSSKDSKSEGVLWVKIADVGIQQMKKDNNSFLPESFFEKHKKFILKKGDYILALTRPILNGKLKIARINEFFNDSLLNQRVGKIVTSNNSDFVYFLLQQDSLIKSIENNIAGSDPPNLSPSEVNNLKIKLPSLKEQQKIARYLSAIDTKIEAVQTQISNTQQYKKGLLQQLFV